MALKGKVPGLAGGVQDAKDGQPAMPQAKGAVHSADIEYAMGTPPTNRVYDWQPDDYWVSDQFSNYYANFIKTGNPNGLGLVSWPATNDKEVEPILQLDVNSFRSRMPSGNNATRRFSALSATANNRPTGFAIDGRSYWYILPVQLLYKT